MQRSLFEELPSPFFNRVKGQGRVGLKATRLAKKTFAKAVQTPELAYSG
jgi:hypothetical protein